MSTKNAAAPIAPKISAEDVQTQVTNFWTSSTQWIGEHWLQIAIGAGIGAAFAICLLWLRSLGPRLAARSTTGKGWAAVFGRAIEKTSTPFIILLVSKPITSFADAPQIVTSAVNFVFTVVAVFQAATWAREVIIGAVEHRTRSEHYSGESLVNAMGLIRLLVTFVVFSIALIVVLDNLGVNVTGLVAGLGVGGIAIGLAAQGIFADLFAALAIIFDRPFRRGDAISYDNSSGTVEEIGLKSTRVRGINGEERIISNKNLLNKEIINNTQRERRRTKLLLGLAYEADTDLLGRVPAILKEEVEALEQVYVRAGFVSFGASTLDFELEFDTPHADFQHAYEARHKVGLAILKRFAAEGIDLPYPITTSLTAGPDGKAIMPYPEVQPVQEVGHTP